MTDIFAIAPDTGLMVNDVRCPQCHNTDRFVVQIVQNVVVETDGVDVMGHQPSLDHFAAQPVDPMSGSRDNDPMGCASRTAGGPTEGCGFKGTVAQFLIANQ